VNNQPPKEAKTLEQPPKVKAKQIGDEGSEDEQSENSLETFLGNGFVKDAKSGSKNIQEDLLETITILRQNLVSPDEFLYSVEQYLTKVIDEFISSKMRIGITLEKKWRSKELKGEQADMGLRQRSLLNSVTHLENWKTTGMNTALENLNNLYSVDNDGMHVPDVKELRSGVESFLNEMRRLLDCCDTINQFDSPKRYQSFNSEEEPVSLERSAILKRYIDNLNEQNQRETFRLVVIGLEKAGKSTFVNAIIGAKLLPTVSQFEVSFLTSFRMRIDVLW
jgi:hypothetical protein